MVDANRVALTADELRAVAAFALASAEEVLDIFEGVAPDDRRARAAVEAARHFVAGAPRGNLQRRTSIDAHRAARDVIDRTVRADADADAAAPLAREAAAHAARAAGDAAASAYLHPLAQASQVGHILRASAHAARALELRSGDEAVGLRAIVRAGQRATPVLREVLRRYPTAPAGRGRVAVLMSRLDSDLRSVGS